MLNQIFSYQMAAVVVTTAVAAHPVSSYPTFNVLWELLRPGIYLAQIEQTEKTSQKPVELEPTTRLAVLTYHHILPDHYMQIYWHNNPWVVSVEDFYRQMRFLYENGFTTVTNQQVMDFLFDDVPLPPRAVKIQFDDGYYSAFVYAYPVLSRFGFTATNFMIGINQYRLGVVQPVFDPSYLVHSTLATIMNSQQVFELASHTFNMHGPGVLGTGIELIHGEYDDIVADMIRSFDFVTNRYAFVYPGGGYNDTVIAALQTAGIRMAFSGHWGFVTRDANPFVLPRIMVIQGMPLDYFSSLFRYFDPLPVTAQMIEQQDVPVILRRDTSGYQIQQKGQNE